MDSTHYEEFAPNVIKRLEKLENFAERVDNFLFVGEPGKPALDVIARDVHAHVAIWCQYAGWCNRAIRFLALTLKRVAIIVASLAAIATAIIGALHFFGLSHAQAARAAEPVDVVRAYVVPMMGVLGTLAVTLVGILLNRLYGSIDKLFALTTAQQRQINVLKLVALRGDPDSTALFNRLAGSNGEEAK